MSVLLSILMGGILSAEIRDGDSMALDYLLVRHDPMALTIRDSGSSGFTRENACLEKCLLTSSLRTVESTHCLACAKQFSQR